MLVVTTVLASIRRRSDDVAYRIAWGGSILVILAGAYWLAERVFFQSAA